MLENDAATSEVEELPVEQVEVEQEPKSMDDTIRETLRGLQDKGITTDEAPLDDVQKAEKIRDEKGKFAKPVEATAEAVQEIAPVEIAPAPNTWKKDAQAEWAKLPANVQAEVARREADFHKGIEQYKTQASYGDQMQRAISPYMATINQFNVSPDVAIGELLKSDHTLRYGNEQQKVGMVLNLFRDYGINPETVFNQLQNGTPQVDPQTYALQQRLAQLEQTNLQQKQMAEQQEMATLNSEIASFAADPLHSHFESVKGHIAALLQAGQAKDLTDAYEQAIYANPQTRALVLAEQQAKERQAVTQKAQAAKSAASINVSRRPSMPVSQPIGSMDDTIRATLRRMQGA